MLNISPHHPFLSCCRATEGLREGAREGGVERWEEESEGGLRTPPSKFKQTFEDNCRKAPEEIMHVILHLLVHYISVPIGSAY